MPEPCLVWEDTEDHKILSGSGLNLVFTRADDRWTHALGLGGSSVQDMSPLAWSLETDPEQSDARTIVSPAYQEIQRHDLGGPPGSPLCVLLTGRLFDHQFSAAVTFALDPDQPGGVIIDWDLADRCRAPFSHLAATYQMSLGSGALADADEHSVYWSGENVGGRLAFLAGPPENVALSEAGRNGSRLQAVTRLDPAVFTHRLRYRWLWSPDAASAS